MAWIYQAHRDKQLAGADADWSVGWVAPDGRRKSKKLGSKTAATKFARKIEGQIEAGTFEAVGKAKWADFRAAYANKIMAAMPATTRDTTEYALRHFERIANPKRMSAITTRTIDDYIAVRRLEPVRAAKGKPAKAVRRVSVATINRELRTIRAALRKAVRWDYLAKMPEIAFLKEPEKLVAYVTPEDFSALYDGCSVAERPEVAVNAPDWWRALLVMAFMTGWRIGSLLALRWEDVDLAAGRALSRAADNKGKRDQLVPLHPLVVDHLQAIQGFDPLVFPWRGNRRQLYVEFYRIQAKAGVKPAGKARYGFHDFRRGFATMNADRLSSEALQLLMQHTDHATTRRYINIARQANPALANLYVPTLPSRKPSAG